MKVMICVHEYYIIQTNHMSFRKSSLLGPPLSLPEVEIIMYDTVNVQTKNLKIWSLGQTISYIKEVGVLSASSKFLAQ